MVCLTAVLTVPRDAIVLRTYLAAVPAAAGLVVYLRLRYRQGYPIRVDVLTTLGVIAQFLLPGLYLVAVPLTGDLAQALDDYLPAYPEAALLALVGQVLFFLGYEAGNRRTKAGHAPIPTPSSPGQLLLTLLPLMGAIWIARVSLLVSGRYYHILRTDVHDNLTLFSALGQIAGLGPCLIAGFYLVAFATREPRWRAVAIGLSVVELVWYFPSGAREPVLVTAAAMLFAYVFVRHLFPVKMLAVGVLAALLLMAFMDAYRYTIATYADPSLVSTQQIRMALRGSSSRLDDATVDQWLSSSIARLSDARSLAAIVQAFPDATPYLGGETYEKILWLPAPRFLFPDKPPTNLTIQSIGLFQGEGGSSPTTLVGEAYANFGWLGLVVLPLIGWISSQYDGRFVGRSSHPVWAAIYVGMAPIIARLPVQPAAIWLIVFAKAFLLAAGLSVWARLLASSARQQSPTRSQSNWSAARLNR
jgi:hypothetical protein